MVVIDPGTFKFNNSVPIDDGQANKLDMYSYNLWKLVSIFLKMQASPEVSPWNRLFVDH